MAAKKKTTKKEEEQPTTVETPAKENEIIAPAPKNKQKFNVGDIVYIKKDADTDLNGFKLFPQYKKYTYTVEAYDAKSDVYTLRRLNLSLRLPKELIIAPSERAHDPLNRRQF